jgi:hypothetical protein
MTFSDSFLSNAGWLFFAAWTAMVAAVSIIAFGSDLLPRRPHLDSSHPADQVRPTQSRAL